MEIWKNINGYLPIYQVSNLGRVRSLARQTKANTGVFNRKERILRINIGKNGYNFVYIYDTEHIKRTIPLHRLVAKVFVDNPLGLNEIDHIDGNKSNNTPENLRWVTHKQNCANPATAHKLKERRQEKANHKKAIMAYSLDGKLIGQWPTITMAAEATGTNRHSISYAANGKYKTSNNLIWRYDES